MSSAKFSVGNPNLSCVVVHGQITIGAVGAVTSYSCSDGTIVRTATGRYTVTLGRVFPSLIAGKCWTRGVTADAHCVNFNSIALSSKTFEIRNWGGGALADPASGNIIEFILVLAKGGSPMLHELKCGVKDLRLIAGAFNPNLGSAYNVGKGWASVSAASGVYTVTLESPFSELVAGFAGCSLSATATGGMDKWAAVSASSGSGKTVEVCVLDSSAGAVDTNIGDNSENWVYFILFVR